MFQSENEDLIPRCAPKPTASDVTAAGFYPSVPEISIVFTQKESGQLTSPPTLITSYSVWKNKCLPSVTYPPEVESFHTELSSTSKRSNVYPMRTGALVVPSMNYTAGQIALNKTDIVKTNTESTQTPYSIESPTPKFSPRCIFTSAYSKVGENSVQQKLSQPFLLNTLEEHVTNSAGTQTDEFSNNVNETHISSLATKKDIAEIKSMIVGMEREHRHLLKTLQNLVEEKFKLTCNKNKSELRDIGTQYDVQLTEDAANNLNKRMPDTSVSLRKRNLVQNPSHVKYDSIEEDLSEKENYDYQHKANIQASKIQRTCTAVMPRTPNIATEQSIVMNELAVKYLPNGNLNGILQEVRAGTKLQNQYELPLKNKENLDKNPTDLSTASYKYLRKYRLLPEEKNTFSPCNNLHKINSENQQENLLDLDMIRCKPKFI